MSKIEASLLKLLHEGQCAAVMIILAEKTDELEQLDLDLESRVYVDQEEQQNTMHREVIAVYEKSQAELIALLEKEKDRIPFTWQSMFLTSIRMNMIIVTGADLELVENIAAIENVAYVEENGIGTIDETVSL